MDHRVERWPSSVVCSEKHPDLVRRVTVFHSAAGLAVVARKTTSRGAESIRGVRITSRRAFSSVDVLKAIERLRGSSVAELGPGVSRQHRHIHSRTRLGNETHPASHPLISQSISSHLATMAERSGSPGRCSGQMWSSLPIPSWASWRGTARFEPHVWQGFFFFVFLLPVLNLVIDAPLHGT